METLAPFQQRTLARLITPSGNSGPKLIMREGETVQELIERVVPKEIQTHVIAWVNGQMVQDLAAIRPSQSDNVLLTLVPQGKALGTLLSIAVMVAAPYLASAALGAGGTIFGMSAAMSLTVATMGISMVGSMLISSLVKPPSLTNGPQKTVEQTYGISSLSNASRKFGAVTRVYGKFRVHPTLAANPLIANLGTESRISALYDFGLGNLDIKELKIGDTDASTFGPELKWHYDSLVPSVDYMSRRVGYEQFTYKLTKGNALSAIFTKPNTIAFDFDLAFNRGLVKLNAQNGNEELETVKIEIKYRLRGSPTWIPVTASQIKGIANPKDEGNAIVLSANTQRPFTVVGSVTGLAPGDYELSFNKITDDLTDSRRAADVIMTLLKSYADGTIVNLTKKHTMLEMRLLATDKISGTVQNLNAVATSILRTTADGVTFTNAPSRNPVWICLDILTGEGNRKPLNDGQIDWPSFIKVAKFCDDNKITSDFVIESATTVENLVSSVLSIARASLKITSNGKYGLLLDAEVDVTKPRQIITQANSWGFQGTRSFAERPHAFAVSFVNPDIQWQKDERMVYDDGYGTSDDVNQKVVRNGILVTKVATKIEKLESFGCTDRDLAWKFGRYMLAQGIHRSETFTVNMDVEQLVVSRGDLVLVAHDVPSIGGHPARVASVNGSRITINEELTTVPTNYSVRLYTGDIITGTVTLAQGNVYNLSNVASADGSTGISPDDLIVFGTSVSVTAPYIVQSIQASSNLVAELTLVRYVQAVYDADKGAIPPWTSGITENIIGGITFTLENVSATASLQFVNRLPVTEVKLNWSYRGYGYHHANVYLVEPGHSPILIGTTEGSTLTYNIDHAEHPHMLGETVKFEVEPIMLDGRKEAPGFASVVPTGDTKAPDALKGFAVNVQQEQVQLFWERPLEDDIDHFIIRYSPDVVGATWDRSQLLARLNHDETTASAGARTGTYMIRAYDTSGNESAVAFSRTTVATLPNINVVSSLDDSTSGWPGTKTNVFVDTNGYLSVAGAANAIPSEATYEFASTVALGQVYEARISSKLKLTALHADGTVAHSDLWDAWLEVSTIDKSSFMSDWVPNLASVTSLAAGKAGNWCPWRPVEVGDFTGNMFKFRVQFRSYAPDVRPSLVSGLVEVDMPDRFDSGRDVVIPVTGLTINFNPAFRATPALAITIDGNQDPLVTDITAKDNTSFTVKLVNAVTKAPASGQIDWVARGYGRQGLTSI